MGQRSIARLAPWRPLEVAEGDREALPARVVDVGTSGVTGCVWPVVAAREAATSWVECSGFTGKR